MLFLRLDRMCRRKLHKNSKNVKKEKKERAFFVNFHNSIEKPRKFLRNSCKTF